MEATQPVRNTSPVLPAAAAEDEKKQETEKGTGQAAGSIEAGGDVQPQGYFILRFLQKYRVSNVRPMGPLPLLI